MPEPVASQVRGLLTRSGLGALLVAVAAAICGWWWRYEELVALAGGLVAALIVALVGARRAHAATVVRRVSTPRVARGESVRVRYRVTNDGRRRSSSGVLVDRLDGDLVRTALPPVGPNQRIELVAHVPTHRRGVHDLGPWSLERHDAFGLAVGRRQSDDVATVIVHPRVHRLAGPYGAMHIVEDEATHRRTASDPMSGFVSLREYVQGDDPRLIHWPTTARMGTLMLREHVELRRPEFTVVLDASSSVGDPSDFEEMVDVAASVAVHAMRSGVDVTLRTTSREHPGIDRPIGREQIVLDLLTPVGQSDLPLPIAELFRTGLDHTAIVVVTGPRGPASTFARPSAMSIIRVGEGARPAPGVALAVEDALEFVRRWRPWH